MTKKKQAIELLAQEFLEVIECSDYAADREIEAEVQKLAKLVVTKEAEQSDEELEDEDDEEFPDAFDSLEQPYGDEEE